MSDRTHDFCEVKFAELYHWKTITWCVICPTCWFPLFHMENLISIIKRYKFWPKFWFFKLVENWDTYLTQHIQLVYCLDSNLYIFDIISQIPWNGPKANLYSDVTVPWSSQRSCRWYPHCVCDCPNESTGPLFQFWSIQGVTKKTAYWYCLSLYCCYKRMRNSVAYCYRNFVVNRREALLTNRLALCYDNWTSRQHLSTVTYYFSKVQKKLGFGCIKQDGLVHGVSGFARFFHFKTTFWVNYWCENFDCRCKWLVCVNSFRCITPNYLNFLLF